MTCSNSCTHCKDGACQCATCDHMYAKETSGHPHAFNLALFLGSLALVAAVGSVGMVAMTETVRPSAALEISASHSVQAETEATTTTSLEITPATETILIIE